MRYSNRKLNIVFQKTGGKCRCCGKQFSRRNHGADGKPGGWQIDHAYPVSRGGTDKTKNLWPMCVNCNRKKADQTWDEFKQRSFAAKPSRRSKRS